MGEQSNVPEKSVDEVINELRLRSMKLDIIWKIASAIAVILPFVYVVLFIAQKLPAAIELIDHFIIALVLLVIIFVCVYMLPMFLQINKNYKEYSNKYKSAYIKPILEEAFKGGDYDATDKVSLKELTEMSMLKKANSAVANDCINGHYKGIKFKRFDLALSYGKPSEASDCALIVCEMKTHLKGEIHIVNKQFKIGNTPYVVPEGLSEVSITSDSFNKKFSVYAKDISEGKGFIAATLIKSLEKLKLGGPFVIIFERGKVYAVIRRKKDVMEAPLYATPSKKHAEKEATEEIEVIKDFIEMVHKDV